MRLSPVWIPLALALSNHMTLANERAIVTIFMVVCFAVFCLPNKWFGWFEYITSLIKIFTFLIIIFASLAITLGAGPKGKIHHGETWTQLPAFKNGFLVSIIA